MGLMKGKVQFVIKKTNGWKWFSWMVINLYWKKTEVLHKDHNYMNFDKKDLEWVEENSHEYQEYIKKEEVWYWWTNEKAESQ